MTQLANIEKMREEYPHEPAWIYADDVPARNAAHISGECREMAGIMDNHITLPKSLNDSALTLLELAAESIDAADEEWLQTRLLLQRAMIALHSCGHRRIDGDSTNRIATDIAAVIRRDQSRSAE